MSESLLNRGVFNLERSFDAQTFNILYTDEYTNCAQRIAHFLHILSGDNLAEPLIYFNQNLEEKAVETLVEHSQIKDGILTKRQKKTLHFRHAIGPRIKNWVGPNAVEDSMSLNEENEEGQQEIENPMQHREMVKPLGLDQLFECFWDVANGNRESTVIVRDPEIDSGNENIEIPDLINITFGRIGQIFRVVGNFGALDENSGFVNDLWFLVHIKEFFGHWLINTNSVSVDTSELKINVFYSSQNTCFPVIFSDKPFLKNSNPDNFWIELSNVNKFANGLRMYINDQTVANSDVSVLYLIDKLMYVFFNVEYLEKINFNFDLYEKKIDSEMIRYMEIMDEDLKKQPELDFQDSDIKKFNRTKNRITEPYLIDMCLCLLIDSLIRYRVFEYEDLIHKLFISMESNLKYEIADTIIKFADISMTSKDFYREYETL